MSVPARWNAERERNRGCLGHDILIIWNGHGLEIQGSGPPFQKKERVVYNNNNNNNNNNSK